MMPDNENWNMNSKLVLNELQRLNENYERMRDNMDSRFNEVNANLGDFRNTERAVLDQKSWIKEVNEIWSPSQMKSAKDEIYKQKNKWIATIAIITFLQILIGFAIALWGKF